jgi:RNA polymerase sigma-70 factor, ECF subfamily
VRPGPGSPAGHEAAERAARTSYGRLVALLSASTGDVALAEDVLADAFERALRSWPVTGVPANPEGWLLTVARNRLRDVLTSAARRHASRRRPGAPWDDSGAQVVDVEALAEDRDRIPDRRLELLFVCAHPAVDPAARTPLMLQTVLGYEASQVAGAFAVSPSAMAQRLVRAKRRIRGAGVPFRVPTRAEMPERLLPVMEAVYAVSAIEAPTPGSMAGEARWLAVLLASLLETEPEPWGLAALLTLNQARSSGRPADLYVPLDEQDPREWDATLVAEGEALLRRAASLPGPPGRFQLEAAISSVHCDRARTGATDATALLTLYAALVDVAPTLGGRVAHAASLGRVEGPEVGLEALDRLGTSTRDHQAAWATRAELLTRAGRGAEAAEAYRTAARLAPDPAVRRWLLDRVRRT